MVDWDKTEAEMEKRLTVLERIAELELREIEYEQIIADVKAREKALREAARRVTGGVSHRDLHVLGPSSRLAEAIDALRAALKQGEG